MKIQLWWIGKTQVPYVKEGIADFCNRIQRLDKFNTRSINVKPQRNQETQRQSEGQAILNLLESTDHLVLLDEKGKAVSSRGLAGMLEDFKMNRTKNLIFVIGGSFGFDPMVYQRANQSISLSKMTFPHDLVRLIFLEQLYRSLTINLNHPYHHD
ncbi:MAG: 23S rRNA (pseudouridine(1915)-N(3))-methyltransferase RlmH [Saprospiraceae bacterium]|nr:23S rRNA (pseudouridine(1915)-N(3))-methyltransferase RlmH [Saprospiraceae bacterium]